MRLVTVRTPEGDRPGLVACVDGVDRVGVLEDVRDVVEILTSSSARARAAAAAALISSRTTALTDLRLGPPVQPGKLLCVGYNYRGHVADGSNADEDDDADPPYPDVFVKTPNTVSGPQDPVAIPAVAEDVDYEGELGIVIGRRARDVSVEQAPSHIGGYTIVNDVSDRAWQRRQSQWTMGKCFDGFAPIGPWVITPDEVDDPSDLTVEVVREGLVTVSQSTSTTIFSAPFLVSYLSSVMTLEPGDVISTGTPQKLTAAQDAHRPLRPGDGVTVRIRGIGELTTTFITPPSPPA